MAIVNLGSFLISIGATPQQYASFEIRDARAYIINASTIVESPNNIFSFFRFRAIINNPTYTDTYTHHLIEVPITVRPFTFLLPFSNLYDGNGTTIIEVERIPNIPGAGDSGGEVTLTLEYDDANDIRTWL